MSYKTGIQANNLQISVMQQRRALKNNPLIAEEELEQIHDAAFGWALSCCSGNQHDAEDVLQRSYIKLLSGKALYNGDASLKTWLFAVIRNTARYQARKKMLRFGILKMIGERDTEKVQSQNDAEQNLLQDEKARMLMNALGCLSKRQQEILELVFYRDLTIEEAAKVVNVSLGTARVHYQRGKENLSQLLEKELKDE